MTLSPRVLTVRAFSIHRFRQQYPLKMTTPPACAIPEQLPHLRVLLIHGLWNPAIWLLPLARRLRYAGFEADIFSYSSVFGRPDIAISNLAARLRGSNANIALLGHSLGGLIALETLRQHQGLTVPRVVCLGSPLLGSRTAQTLIARGWETWTLGRSAALLQAGCAPWQGRAQVGLVAGNVPRGLGRLLARLDAPSDGTVSVAETRLPGLTDHCIVRASHSSLIFSAEAARQSMHFLLHGRFTGDHHRELMSHPLR